MFFYDPVVLGAFSGIGGTEVSSIQNGQPEEIEVAGRDRSKRQGELVACLAGRGPAFDVDWHRPIVASQGHTLG
jgi:hypothetical protein